MLAFLQTRKSAFFNIALLFLVAVVWCVASTHYVARSFFKEEHLFYGTVSHASIPSLFGGTDIPFLDRTFFQINGDKDITFDIVAGKRDTNALYSKRSTRGGGEANIQFDKLGLELLEKDGRVSVEEILPNGAVDAANTKNDNGIREGDFIIEVNRMPVRSVDDVIAAMKASHNNTVVFLIERKVRGDQPRRFFVAIPIK